ncbi:MAG: HAD-IIIA family hydrolase [Desulfarculus sp.]|nr:HAD-IIIA family hydrolase [Pseudomonadota bacterium]MBV1715132.1 HAD-IIIA family hydrolase [Desulfarculus sp.]MBU4575133.1 HAD-IIIA family hydrolase [Pseudomonadota bacterium]MBU4598816.1 HAD-IIIA family hydrolase [Pseudomonadota bacterium]MBV1736630.1 HAD-IIIA family hydrolase [Desulfarculus sp.]
MGVGEIKRAVFLDRDGVLNPVVMRGGSPASPRGLDEFSLTPGAGEQVARLKEAGYVVIVVTNQPDVARGLLPQAELEAMHRVLAEGVGPDEIRFCPHDDHHQCACRKPKPGMLTQAADERGIDLTASWLVGDGYKDIEAARAAGVRAVLISADYNAQVAASRRVADLAEAVDLILEQG